ncbi:MAG: hypothetical protein WC824_11130 [Bacteroidota bacterium]
MAYADPFTSENILEIQVLPLHRSIFTTLLDYGSVLNKNILYSRSIRLLYRQRKIPCRPSFDLCSASIVALRERGCFLDLLEPVFPVFIQPISQFVCLCHQPGCEEENRKEEEEVSSHGKLLWICVSYGIRPLFTNI